jgi:hypothetical protein
MAASAAPASNRPFWDRYVSTERRMARGMWRSCDIRTTYALDIE